MMEITVKTKVAKIEERSEAVRSFPAGKDEQGKVIYQVERRNLGWFVLFERSNEMLHLGFEKPENVYIGQPVDIVLRFK